MGEVAFAEIDAEFDGKEGCEFSQVCDGMFFDVGAELPMCISIIYLFFHIRPFCEETRRLLASHAVHYMHTLSPPSPFLP